MTSAGRTELLLARCLDDVGKGLHAGCVEAWKRCVNLPPEVASWASRVFLFTLARHWLSLDLNETDHVWIKKIIVATLAWVAQERTQHAEEHWLYEPAWLLSESHLWRALGQDHEARECFDLIMRWFHSPNAAAEPERSAKLLSVMQGQYALAFGRDVRFVQQSAGYVICTHAYRAFRSRLRQQSLHEMWTVEGEMSICADVQRESSEAVQYIERPSEWAVRLWVVRGFAMALHSFHEQLEVNALPDVPWSDADFRAFVLPAYEWCIHQLAQARGVDCATRFSVRLAVLRLLVCAEGGASLYDIALEQFREELAAAWKGGELSASDYWELRSRLRSSTVVSL